MVSDKIILEGKLDAILTQENNFVRLDNKELWWEIERLMGVSQWGHSGADVIHSYGNVRLTIERIPDAE